VFSFLNETGEDKKMPYASKSGDRNDNKIYFTSYAETSIEISHMHEKGADGKHIIMAVFRFGFLILALFIRCAYSSISFSRLSS
jgi:hypothetical protein